MGGSSEHRYLQVLDAGLAKALALAARRARKSPTRLLNEVVHEYLRDRKDYQAAARTHARVKKGERTYSHADVKKRLGLAG